MAPLLLLSSLGTVAVVLLLIVIVTLCRRSSLPTAASRKLQQEWQHVLAVSDPSRQVLEADKVLDNLLKAIGYSGTLGEKLKRAGSRLHNLDAIWRAHKLRNRIAHEVGVQVTEREAGIALQAIERTLKQFGVK